MARGAMNVDVNQLADFAALKKLAAALWQQDGTFHGAAIMVGAGFSRSAATSGNPAQKMPLWFELCKQMGEELGSSSSDPLRLAEEYQAFFGPQSMHDNLKTAVNDQAFQPGALHDDLLRLPWSEVLTTNWDTLLERAAAALPERVYNVVRKQEDLASARSPRIVKLHGTIVHDNHLVFTQEDYRRYPARYAAFVNYARQVFIENELCLLGFSGEDPNFLAWAGWVRDHLAGHARRIYLVGALGLNAAKRKYLESINIAPIDLAPLVADYDDRELAHREATKLFLQALVSLEPKAESAWSPTYLNQPIQQNKHIDALLREQNYKWFEDSLATLQADRNSYPGWLVLPSHLQDRVLEQASFHAFSASNLRQLPEQLRARLIYERIWRGYLAHDPLDAEFSKLLLDTVLDEQSPLSKRERLEGAVLLLKNQRWADDVSNSCSRVEDFIESNAKHWSDAANEMAYYRAIQARDAFDYEALQVQCDRISIDEPWWKLRKASLLVELGTPNEANLLVAQAYRELLVLHHQNRRSLFLLSRLAWAHWLYHVLNLAGQQSPFPSFYREHRCDPWAILDDLRVSIDNALDRQRKDSAVVPNFAPGSYRDGSSSVTFTSGLHPLIVMTGLLDTVGMPLRWQQTNLFCRQAEKLVELDGVDGLYSFSLAARGASTETAEIIKKTFSRLRVARFAYSQVEQLADQCVRAINYWKARAAERAGPSRQAALPNLRVFIEILARISVRLPPERSRQLFILATELSKQPDLHHLWLKDALGHLLRYSLESVPENEQADLVPHALEVPLAHEIGLNANSDWPNPVIEKPGERMANPVIDRRIAQIIQSVNADSKDTGAALIRLIPLLDANYLTPSERVSLLQQVWGSDPANPSLQGANRLFAHALLKLPNHQPENLKDSLSVKLFEAGAEGLFEEELLEDLINSVGSVSADIRPSAEQARRYFELMTRWRPKAQSQLEMAFSHGGEQRKGTLISKALGLVVAPHLGGLSSEAMFAQLDLFYREVQAPGALVAYIYFADTDPVASLVEKTLRHALQHQDAKFVSYAAYAIREWRTRVDSPITRRLVSLLVMLFGPQRLSVLPEIIESLRTLLERGLLSAEESGSLIDTLPVVFDCTRYDATGDLGHEAATISIVRTKCVQLARSLSAHRTEPCGELARVMLEAKEDPLPEVRFA
ncbi:hypothetical protein YSA_11014 [Pseudomonas putida ND6]|uniref:Uncharacterized protein n=3 Tax=Pseudomonas TaxID=286 RepID=I3V4R9_PSEPU|nr:hypothetical protein YSA_11014 [Pseudomonas putida ND6]